MSTCCGCHLESDYGTSTVIGDGSPSDPFSVTPIDPLFMRPVVRTSFQLDQSINSGIDTAVSWTGVKFDSHNMFTLDTPTRLTVKIAGFYLMGYYIWWYQTFGVYKKQSLRLNGTTVLDFNTKTDGTNFARPQSSTYMWFFNVNDYMELVVNQTSGVAKLLLGTFAPATGLGNPGMWMVYLGKKV